MTAAKFNCSVPGTVPSKSSECVPTETDADTTISGERSTTAAPASPTTTPYAQTTTASGNGAPPIEASSSVYYGLAIGIVVSATIILACTIIVCLILYALHKRRHTRECFLMYSHNKL